MADAVLEVRVSPANNALRSNIEGYIGSLGDRNLAALERYTSTVERQAEQASQALGFYHARISSRVTGGDNARLVLNVEPGEPVKLRNVTIRVEGPAASFKSFQTPRSRTLRPGQPLNHGEYEGAKRAIEAQASRYGYFSGRFTQQRLVVDPAGGVADIEIVYDSGPRYLLGDVSFSGDSIFDDELLHRMVPFEPGTPYDSEIIAELYRDLQSSGYFESIRVDVTPTSAQNQRLPVDIRLAMRKPRSFDLGLGYSTDVGPRGRAGWTRHWANSKGHSYGAEMELSAPRQNVGLWYDIPLDPPITDKLRWAGGYQYEELANTDSLSKLLTFGPEWHSELPSGWTRVLSLKWQREEYRLGDDSGLSTLLMPGASYSYLKSDNKLDPRNGYRLQFAVSAAKEGLLSDTDLIHGEATIKGLTTLWGRHRFLARGQFGGNFSGEYRSVPPSLRFFAGGDQSVRGYDYQTLSPENSDGDRIGGRYMVAGSLEYQYSIAEKWRIATFVDQGNSFNSLDLPSLKTGVGLGVRWVSPVGPIRLDLAHALDDDGGVRLHFSMGPEL
ncbi:outer membrane protein assembly factor [Pseudomonas matsuisoli]|uniref:Translocation and assembly module subunit TamA n=2 Tax=Pseudomonas matsuisoli TaxID=1515666 RepID=A0A917PNP7_9PSED|nr:outer membrane protein assembly factor [Pseudomonas matsuisoli]